MDNRKGQALLMKLLEGEEIRAVLGSRQGMANSLPEGEDYLMITSQRVMAVWREETRHRQVTAPLGRIDGVEVTELVRDYKPLVTGGLFMLAGVMVPWLAALFNLNGIVAWLLAIVLVVLGAVTASAYFVRDQMAVISFRAGGVEASLPLRSPQAVRGAHALTIEFFALTAPPPVPDSRSAPYALQSPNGGPIRWTRDAQAPALTVVPAAAHEGIGLGQGAETPPQDNK